MIEIIQKYLANKEEHYFEKIMWWEKAMFKANEMWQKNKDMFTTLKTILLHEYIVTQAENKDDVQKFKMWLEIIPMFLDWLNDYIKAAQEDKEFVRKY